MTSQTSIPSFDFSQYLSSTDDTARKEAAKALAATCHEQGVVGITNHGVPEQLVAEAFAMSKKLFDLPMEEKLKAPHPDGFVPHRGYSAPGREKAYNKDELESDQLEVKESGRKITDFKVSRLRGLMDVLTTV